MVQWLHKDIKIQEVDFCKSCISGKMFRYPFGTRTKSSRVL